VPLVAIRIESPLPAAVSVDALVALLTMVAVAVLLVAIPSVVW